MSDTVFEETMIVTAGRIYPATTLILDILKSEAQSQQAIPIMLIDTPGGTVVVGEEDLRDVDPMLLGIIKAHLEGRWVMIMDVSRENGETAARDKAVLESMPLAWGKHKRVMSDLGINRRQLQRSLKRLLKASMIDNPARGYYYPIT